MPGDSYADLQVENELLRDQIRELEIEVAELKGQLNELRAQVGECVKWTYSGPEFRQL